MSNVYFYSHLTTHVFKQPSHTEPQTRGWQQMPCTRQLLQKLRSDSEQKISFPAASTQEVSKGQVAKEKEAGGWTDSPGSGRTELRLLAQSAPNSHSSQAPRDLRAPGLSYFTSSWNHLLPAGDKRNCYRLIEWLLNYVLKSFEFSIKWPICWFHQKTNSCRKSIAFLRWNVGTWYSVWGVLSWSLWEGAEEENASHGERYLKRADRKESRFCHL